MKDTRSRNERVHGQLGIASGGVAVMIYVSILAVLDLEIGWPNMFGFGTVLLVAGIWIARRIGQDKQ